MRIEQIAVAALGSVLFLALGLKDSGQLLAQTQTRTVATGSEIPTGAKPVTIPVGIRVKGLEPEAELQMVDLAVTEDGDPQTILSIRAIGTNSPLTLAVLVQDDLVQSVANEMKPVGDFIRRLPKGSRVMVGYLRTGSLQVRQKFTTDLERAAKGLRSPLGVASAGPSSPYLEVREAIKRFDAQPSGRRAILLISDGLDISRGVESSSASQSVDLQRAINDAQRRGIAIYAIYSPSAAEQSPILIANAQGSLQRLADETGGRAFFQGTGAPVSFDPFLKNLTSSLETQIALTYLSTHAEKGFHRIKIRSATPGVELEHPAGYTRQ
jgi:VWFA-related protein